MSEMCGDNRFELIGEFKGELIEGTNIESSPEEMAVLDNILFRIWQMGWLDKLKSMQGNGWQIEKRKDDSVVRTDLVCACGAVVWQDEILFADGHAANRLFCPACGLNMRSPWLDSGGKYLKNAWKMIVMKPAERAKNMVIINLNDFVRFKLTDRGREIFEHHLDDALKYLPDVDRGKLEQATDFNGYKKMQLHRFMNIFGPYLMNGAPVPVENVEIIYDIPETAQPT